LTLSSPRSVDAHDPVPTTYKLTAVIFGENLLALIVLALGAALAVGNTLALLRPRTPDQVGEGELARPPLGRSLFMIALGLLAAVWAVASLLSADPVVSGA